MASQLELERAFRELGTAVQPDGKGGLEYPRRLHNIEWARDSLDRSGFEWNLREKMVLVYGTTDNEQVYLRYPGKESDKSRRPTDIRPWDFRPKLVMPQGEDYGVDLSFGQIWQYFFERFGQRRAEDEILVRALACTLYRLAYLLDHELTGEAFVTSSRAFDTANARISKPSVERYPPFWAYRPPSAVKMLSRAVGKFHGMSLEAALYYYDILSWNEACKYYYRDTIAKPKQRFELLGRNTALTHLRVLGYLSGDVEFGDLLDGFARSRGVSKITQREAVQLCRPFLGERPVRRTQDRS